MPTRTPIWLYASWAIAAGFAVWALVAAINRQWAQVLAAGIVSLAVGLLALLGGEPYGALAPLVGHDGRTSTSKVQSALWTVLLVWGMSFLLGQHVFDHQDINVVLPSDTWDQYLVVLGGPFAAAVLAKGIVTTQIANGTLTKTAIPPTDQATIAQVVQNDSNQTDLVDSQYFLFNVVAIVFFIVEIAAKPVLPVLPAPLLAVTSGAAALYVGNKAVTTNKPNITSVLPLSPGPGDMMTIIGSNLLGGGSVDDLSVLLAGVGQLTIAADPAPTDSTIDARLPINAPPGSASITVVNADGNSSDPWTSLSIASTAPAIVGLGSATVTPGSPLSVYGTKLTNALAPGARATVFFDGANAVSGDVVQAPGDIGAQMVTVDVPAGVAGPQTSITVVASGVSSQPFVAYVA